jgi:DNA polymerase-3 subunit alpha
MISIQPRFIHLRVHSDYSMVDGLAKVKSLIKYAQDLAMPAIALTDHMNLCGLVKFYQSSLAAGVKPIIGLDISLYHEEESSRLTLLAMNERGYKNITELVSLAYLRGYIDHRPQVLLNELRQHSDGIIVLSGGFLGPMSRPLLNRKQEEIGFWINFFETHFKDRFYLEVSRAGRHQEEDLLHITTQIAEEFDLPLVATNDVVFIKEAHFDAHEIRVAIHDGYTLADPNRPQNYSEKQYLKTEAEMSALFDDLPQALQNTVEISKRCNVQIKLDEYFLPNFPTGQLTTEAFLIQASREGLEKRLAKLFPELEARNAHRSDYDERLNIELEVINKMGFPGYFLIVMEFIHWAKNEGIPVGPGRGSGAGSLVAYALSITDLDPIALDLLFERFLNPERVSMPDFDIDFCMDRRDEVIEHTASIYGRNAVSQIITFGTMAAKAVIRDVGRVLGHPYGFVDRIAKLVPPDPGMTLAKAFEIEPGLPELYEKNEDVKELIDMARLLEGVTRNAGKHAGGVVIAPTKITDFSPIYCDENGSHPVTQFDKNDVETAGLVKFDFLGLRTLTIINWALKLINESRVHQGSSELRIESIDLADQHAFELLKKAETTAVFQLESRGMKDLIKRLQPDCFEDIIALVALFRPGPLQSGMVDNFIDRKHLREPISYPDPQYQHSILKPILEPTYGIILYQEQVMQIAQELAGYTLGGADLLRRAMGKKKPEEMAKQRGIFEQGAKDNGIDGQLAIKIFDLVEKFAGYGFNKSHSAAYALVSYQTLWLKAHYPSYFLAAVMSADMDNTDKIVTLVDEAKHMDICIVSPHVNLSDYHFTIDKKQQIVYGLGAVKGVGQAVVENIVSERQLAPFKDLFDFCSRIDVKKANKRVLEKLIMAGALDGLGPHRATLLETLPQAMTAAIQHHEANSFGQHDLFGLLNDHDEGIQKQNFVQCAQWSSRRMLKGESDTLGLYLTGHPIDEFSQELDQIGVCRLGQLQPTSKNKTLLTAGLVIASRTMMTKRGKKIAFCTLDDHGHRVDVMLFGEVLSQDYASVVQNAIVVVDGEVSTDDFSGGYKVVAKSIKPLEVLRSELVDSIELDFSNQTIDNKALKQLELLQSTCAFGKTPVILQYSNHGLSCKLKLNQDFSLALTDECLEQLELAYGPERVFMHYNKR